MSALDFQRKLQAPAHNFSINYCVACPDPFHVDVEASIPEMFGDRPPQPTLIRHADKPKSQFNYYVEKLFEMTTTGLDSTQSSGRPGGIRTLDQRD